MAYCPNCGTTISYSVKYCPNCGARQPENKEPGYTPGSGTYTNYPNSNGYSQPSYDPRPAPVSTGGLMAWSIITLFLCTIPGIVAIVKTTGINKAATVQEQQSRISSARTWCIIGTILGILALIGSFANGMY